MPPFLTLLGRPLLVAGLLAGAVPGPVAGQPPQQPALRKPFPHFRPAEKRKLRHYKPKTWREKAPEPKPRPGLDEALHTTP